MAEPELEPPAGGVDLPARSGCPTAAELAQQMLGDPETEYSEVETEILERIAAGERVGHRTRSEQIAGPAYGARLADRVAAVGGSWGFIIAFGVVLFGWMIVNGALPRALGFRFDPYPFIFLNLMLSMLAAIQAPIIMMSQNRAAAKDRLAQRIDFETNLRAELDIERIHYKLDAVLAQRIDLIDRRLDDLEGPPGG